MLSFQLDNQTVQYTVVFHLLVDKTYMQYSLNYNDIYVFYKHYHLM